MSPSGLPVVSALGCLCLLPGMLTAQFEGLVESENVTTEAVGGAERFTMRIVLRPDRARIETSGGGGDVVLIYRADRSVVWFLNMADSSYQELPHASSASPPADRAPKETLYIVRKPGRTREILGYRCEQLLFERGEEVTEIWGTRALADLSATLARVLGQDGVEASGWQLELRALKIFPLSATIRVGGRVLESQTVTRIRREKPDGRLFDLPPRFRKEAPAALPGGGGE